MRNEADSELIKKYFAGEKEALEILIKRYLRPAKNFVFKYVRDPAEAEDISQEAFFRAWKNLKKFDQKKSFKTWLFAIAKNAALDYLKKKKATPFSAFENEYGENPFLETIADPAFSPAQNSERLEAIGALKEAAEKLSSRRKAALWPKLKYGLTFRQIAEASNESVNTVKSRYRRALKMFKKLLAE